MKGLRIIIAAGMIDRKLFSKIQPLIELKEINEIHLVRIQPYFHKGIINHNPTGFWATSKALAEIYRLLVLIKLIIAVKPHLLIGIGTIPHGIFVNVLGKLFFKKTIILLMGNNDLYLTYPDRKIRQRLLFWITSLSDFIGTRGTNSKKWLIEKGINGDHIFIPHNVFDFDEFFPVESLKIYDLVYVGLINFYKRVDLLVDVVYQLVNKYGYKTLKMVIVGKGRIEKEILEYVKHCELEENIIFLPQGDQNYLNIVLNQSKVFVMTSQGEGLPMAIVEAMSCGIPAVAFDDADISDVVKHGYNGLLCNLNNIDHFALNVHSLLSQEDYYKKMSKGALKIREEKKHEYSSENLIEIWKRVLHSLFV